MWLVLSENKIPSGLELDADHELYAPKMATIVSVKEEVGGERPIKSFRLRLDNGHESFSHRSGQCLMVSVLGVGESMISISSPPTRPEYLQLSVIKVGQVTDAMHMLSEGDRLGVRGPLGNGFPLKEWEGKNLVFIAGGIGIAPLRSVYTYAIDRSDRYGDLSIIYGSRTSTDQVYSDELHEIAESGKVPVHLSVDVEENGWSHFVGFVPSNVMEIKPSPDNTVAVVCGPPIMIHVAAQNLLELGFKEEQIYTTMENRMKCGVGKCGRCNIGPYFVCKDGPVFSWAQVSAMKKDY